MKQLFITCIMLYSIAQAQMIKPGSYAGNITATDVLQYDKPRLQLSDFKGRVIILNFWNQACISCIQNFAKYEALQQQYKEKIQIIMLCKEDKDSTLRFFAKRKKIKPPAVPMVTNAAAIWYRFNLDNTPYHAWLDEKGNAIAITDAVNLTGKNLNLMIKGLIPAVPDIQVTGKTTIEKKPEQMPLWRSAISPYNRSLFVQWENRPVDNGRSVQLFITNASVIELFQIAFRELNKHDFSLPQQVEIRTKEPALLEPPVDQDSLNTWKLDNLYCYELIVPLGKREKRYDIMKEDLQRFFGMSAYIEKQKRNVWALVRITGEDKLKTKGGKPIDELSKGSLKYPFEKQVREFTNQPFHDFSERLKHWLKYHNKELFIDKTGYSGNIDLQVREEAIAPFNLDELKIDLQKFGLDLVQSQKWVDVLVIKEKSSQ